VPDALALAVPSNDLQIGRMAIADKFQGVTGCYELEQALHDAARRAVEAPETRPRRAPVQTRLLEGRAAPAPSVGSGIDLVAVPGVGTDRCGHAEREVLRVLEHPGVIEGRRLRSAGRTGGGERERGAAGRGGRVVPIGG